jgi:hypothetical protein
MSLRRFRFTLISYCFCSKFRLPRPVCCGEGEEGEVDVARERLRRRVAAGGSQEGRLAEHFLVRCKKSPVAAAGNADNGVIFARARRFTPPPWLICGSKTLAASPARRFLEGRSCGSSFPPPHLCLGLTDAPTPRRLLLAVRIRHVARLIKGHSCSLRNFCQYFFGGKTYPQKTAS